MGSLKNHLLISMPHLTDPYFERSVIYLCEHDREGAMGLVINKPIDEADRREILTPENRDELDLTTVPTVYFGGPVMLERGIVLHSAEYKTEGTLSLSPHLSLTSHKAILEDIRQGKGPQHYRLMLGHAGWGKQQLEREIEQGDWLVQTAEPKFIFDTPDRQKWRLATNSFGIEAAQIAGRGGMA